MRLFCLLLLCGLASSCGPSAASMATNERQLIQEASRDIPAVRDFHQLYPDCRINVYSQRFERGTTVIQAEEIVFDRYRLTLSVHIEVNPKTVHIISTEPALITLVEVLSVTGDANGPLKSDYGENFKISLEQWRKIVESGGQFSSAGIAVKMNQPAPGISNLKARIRQATVD